MKVVLSIKKEGLCYFEFFECATREETFMEADKIMVGQKYRCTSPLVKGHFTATVEKMYDLSALVEVDQCEGKDADKIDDLNRRLVIPFYCIDPA